MTRSAMTGRRGFVVALATGLLGAGVVLLSAGRVWASHTFVAAGGATQHVVVHGHDVAASLPALATASITLVLLVIATRSWLRRIVGLLVVVAGGTMAGVAITARGDVRSSLTRHAFGVPRLLGDVGATAWLWIALVGAALVVAAGAAVVIFGATWPVLGRRYDAPAVAATDDDASVWSALDRGEDPTA